MRMRSASVNRFAMQRPSDISQLDALVSQNSITPSTIRAIVAKTEGNGSLTDYTTELAEHAFTEWLGKRLGISQDEVRKTVMFFVDGGAEGLISPHGLVFSSTETEGNHSSVARLAFGWARGTELEATEIGRSGQIGNTAEAVQTALEDADLMGPEEVQGVLVTAPTLALSEIQRMKQDGQEPAALFPDVLAAASCRAAAIGASLALGEIARESLERVQDARAVDARFSRTIVIAKPFTREPRVLVIGNSRHWTGPFAASYAAMADALDAAALRSALEMLGLPGSHPLRRVESERLIACFCKTEIGASNRIRGRRHVMLEDADIHYTRHLRTAVGAVVAATIGHPQVFVSAGTDASSAVGGSMVCVIGKVEGIDSE